MKPLKDESLRGIFELRALLENVFFKSYESTIALPKTLNHTHFKTMIILNFEGELHMSEVSQRLNLEKGSFTTVANTLIDLGFVQKQQSTTDRRVYTVSLTEQGKAFAQSFAENHWAFMKAKLSKLSEAERSDYVAAISLLKDLTEKMQIE